MAVGKTILGGMLLAAVAFGQAAAPRASRLGAQPGGKKPFAKKPEAAPAPVAQPVMQPQIAPPVVPLRPSQMPAVPPRISFQNGALTIVAENSTMADIIAQLRAATGIKIETVGGPSGERVAARIGPAPVRDVILSLVQGSQYDFIILGVEGQPGAVERVILTPKTSGGTLATSGMAPRPTISPNVVYQAPQQEVSDDDGNEGFAPAPQPQTQPPQTDPNQPARTPEQLLEELRRIEEQRNNPGARPQRPPRSPQF